jgi:hypothetical protein
LKAGYAPLPTLLVLQVYLFTIKTRSVGVGFKISQGRRYQTTKRAIMAPLNVPPSLEIETGTYFTSEKLLEIKCVADLA